MQKSDKIYVAGHKGMVGSAIWRALEAQGYTRLIGRTHTELDLTNEQDVARFFAQEKPDFVFLAAAKVGGIMANNTYPATFLFDNLQIQNNVIHQSYLNNVKKLLFLGSSCIYPKDAPQPIKEEYLLQGQLEKTNEPYAIAKIAGIKMCQSYNRQYGTNFIAAMPTNLYGINDNFDLNTSHVLPAMIRKFHDAKLKGDREVTLWGTGKPYREFLHVDDMADACLFIMEHFTPTKEENEKGEIFFNIGSGTDVTIHDLAQMVQRIVGYQGNINWDTSKPDGTFRKKLDLNRLHKLGWQHQIELENGITQVYQWFKENYSKII